jgi:hypothetical protein
VGPDAIAEILDTVHLPLIGTVSGHRSLGAGDNPQVGLGIATWTTTLVKFDDVSRNVPRVRSVGDSYESGDSDDADSYVERHTRVWFNERRVYVPETD